MRLFVNKLSIAGNVASEPKRHDYEGKIKVTFSLAVNNYYMGKESLDGFFLCELWGKGAERFLESITKGDNVYLEGKIAQYKNNQTKETVTYVKGQIFGKIDPGPSAGQRQTITGAVNTATSRTGFAPSGGSGFAKEKQETSGFAGEPSSGGDVPDLADDGEVPFEQEEDIDS